MTHKILVPLDGSDHAAKALDIALDMAMARGAALVLVHVLLRDAEPEELKRLARLEPLPEADRRQLEKVAPLSSTAMAVAADYARITVPTDILRRVGAHILAAAEGQARARGLTEVTTRLEDGEPARCILSVAEQAQADTIVMGSRGLGYVQGLLLGSVSHKVSHRATGTCVLVK
jgi:nucleotide-binding universal stress UspA family protein